MNAGVSLQSLMVLLGHVSAEMSLRYGRCSTPLSGANTRGPSPWPKRARHPTRADPVPVTLVTDWREAPLIKSRLAGGYCLRAQAQGPCAYANICEHCPNFRTDPTYWPVLAAQRVDAERLLFDAQDRGWVAEADRHRRLIERIDLHMARAQAG